MRITPPKAAAARVTTAPLALPPTHVFEGMRDILLNQQVNATHMLAAFGLNIVYLAAAIAFFLRSLYVTRRGQGLFSYAE